MDKIRILLVSDFVLLRAGLGALLADLPNVEVVGECPCQEDVVGCVLETLPDIVLLGISRDEECLFKALAAMREGAAPRIIAVSAIEERDFVLRLLRAGVQGYLSSQEATAELVRALDAVAQGEVFLCPSASKALLAGYRDQNRVA